MDYQYNKMTKEEFYELLKKRKLEYKRARKVNKADNKTLKAKKEEVDINKRNAKIEFSRTEVGKIELKTKDKNLEIDKKDFELTKKEDKLKNKKAEHKLDKKRAKFNLQKKEDDLVVEKGEYNIKHENVELALRKKSDKMQHKKAKYEEKILEKHQKGLSQLEITQNNEDELFSMNVNNKVIDYVLEELKKQGFNQQRINDAYAVLKALRTYSLIAIRNQESGKNDCQEDYAM